LDAEQWWWIVLCASSTGFSPGRSRKKYGVHFGLPVSILPSCWGIALGLPGETLGLKKLNVDLLLCCKKEPEYMNSQLSAPGAPDFCCQQLTVHSPRFIQSLLVDRQRWICLPLWRKNFKSIKPWHESRFCLSLRHDIAGTVDVKYVAEEMSKEKSDHLP